MSVLHASELVESRRWTFCKNCVPTCVPVEFDLLRRTECEFKLKMSWP